MIKCTNAACGAENEDGAKFCEHCGTQLPQYKECPSCHSKAKLTARFCAECGCKLSEQSNISQQSDKKTNLNQKFLTVNWQH